MGKEDNSEIEQSRRRFIKSAAKLAVYAPPAMIVASRPGFAEFATSSGTEYEKKGKKKGKKNGKKKGSKKGKKKARKRN